jgi:AcrR family transcriptional regulator
VKTMGRPREFDLNEALDRAMEVFWRNGYEGASVAELCEAMGIRPPSLYAAFENKAGLFRHVIDRYLEQKTSYVGWAFEAPSARGMVERLVLGCADFLSERGQSAGCLFMRSAAGWGDSEECVSKELSTRRAEGEARLRECLERAAAQGELPPGIDPGEFTQYIAAVLEGMSARAAAGATARELRQIGEMALRAWPE